MCRGPGSGRYGYRQIRAGSAETAAACRRSLTGKADRHQKARAAETALARGYVEAGFFLNGAI